MSVDVTLDEATARQILVKEVGPRGNDTARFESWGLVPIKGHKGYWMFKFGLDVYNVYFDTGQAYRRRNALAGRLGEHKWSVVELGDGRHFIAERLIDGKFEHEDINAHCLACAKAEVLTNYGGEVDLRGWHKAGSCGAWLKVMAMECSRTEPPGE